MFPCKCPFFQSSLVWLTGLKHNYNWGFFCCLYLFKSYLTCLKNASFDGSFDSSVDFFKYSSSDVTLIDGSPYVEYHRIDSLSVRNAYINLKMGYFQFECMEKAGKTNYYWRCNLGPADPLHALLWRLGQVMNSPIYLVTPGRSMLFALGVGCSCFSVMLCCSVLPLKLNPNTSPASSPGLCFVDPPRDGVVCCSFPLMSGQTIIREWIHWDRAWCQTCFTVDALLNLKIIAILCVISNWFYYKGLNQWMSAEGE